ncbi:unnamed protein product [Notodromas monacha]|uniref:Ig-like domain-containing protein n=1 Tax=Notodromas monacha TaxID=399045 RepID=A0A7R9BV05_9CRUS|nr:unnamed protein product [Notodromas monacha]CAG0921882.1 unnamed protein product [Notodromas monacha]
MIPERTATLHASVIATVFFVVLCQLVHGIPPPIMNVTTEMYYEINDGENFYVSCTGIQPIQWTHTMGPSQSVTDGRTTKIRNDYVSVFELENAKYWQTGKIQCGYLNATNVAWIYLYVKHPRYLIANWTEDAIAKLVVDDSTDSLIIPCRPTAHDVHVVLQKDGQNVTVIERVLHLGLHVKSVLLVNGMYRCCPTSVDFGFIGKDCLDIRILRNQPLSNPDISRAPGQSIWFIVDLRMRLQCIVSAEKYVHVEFNWALPRFSTAKNDNRFSTSETYDSDKKEYVSVLTISKTKLTDAGIYTCDVGGGSSPANYSVTVHDGSPVIQKVKAEPWNITVPVGKGVAQWVVDVLAYPPPTLSLIRTRRPDLFRKTDYEIVNNAETEGTVLVQLVGVQLEDFGNYTLKVVTATMSRSITLRVEVTDQPKVETIQFADSGMVPGSFVMVDTKVSIECIASGYPVPEIDWIFRPCETPDECEGSPVHVNEHRTRNKEAIEISRDEEYKIVSTLKLYASESGSYHCGAGFSNFYDEKKFFLRVTDIGGEDGFGVVKRVNDESTWEPLSDRFDAYEGDKIVIKCGASKFNYTNAVAWDYRTSSKGEFKPALPLNWNTSPASSDLSWGLRISLSKAGRAENGEYRCSATNTVKGERNWVAFTMNIVPMEEPAFDGTTNMFKASKAGKPMAIKNGDVLILNCSVSGVPTPNIEWLKDSMRFNETKDHRIFVNGSLLTFSPAIAEKDNGRYSCRARNKAGETEISVDLEVVATSASFGGMGLPGFFVLVTVVGLLVFTVIGACIYARKLRKDKEKLSRLLTEKEAKQFREGELLMIIEYCPLGSLDKYLRKHKVNFKDQFSSVSGLPVPSIRNRSFNSQSTASVVDPMAYVTMGTEQSLRENSVEFNRNRQRMSSASTESCTVRTAVTGVTDLDTDGNGRGGALWAEVYEAERNLDNDRTLSTADLLSWAYNLMHSCWEAAPDQRPSFAALTSDFGALVDPQTKLRLSAMNEKFERHNGELFAEYGDFLANFGMDGGSSGSKSRSRSVTSRGTRYLPEDANGYLIPNPSLRTPSAYVVMGGGDSVRFSRDGEQPPAFYENMNVRSAEPPRVEATVANTNQTPVKPLTGQSYANQLDFSRFLSVPSSEDPGERDAGDGLHEVDPLLVKYNPGYVTSDVPSTDL